MARRFQDAALPDPVLGDPSLRGAQRFVAGTSDFLNRYPVLGDRLRRAVVEMQGADRQRRSVEDQLSALTATPEAKFADARAFAEFDEILGLPRPAEAMAQLRRTARELGPEAETGLQASATQYILSKMRTYKNNQRGLTSETVLNPSNRGVEDANVAYMLEELFDPDQLRNMRQVIDEVARVDESTAARRGGTTELITPGPEDTILQLVARTVGLFGMKAATPPGLGTIQGPTQGSNAANYLRKVVTTEAAQDMVERAILQKTPEDAALFRALLSPALAPDFDSQARRVIESWLRTNGYTQGLDAEDPLEKFRQGLGLPSVNLPSTTFDPTDPFWAR
jgi:hypothetical protein